MILTRLRIRRFSGFIDRSLEFAPTINVIVGPNETGKSTIRNAIRTVLYENPSTTSARLDAYRTWGEEQPPALELEFEANGRRCLLLKDFHARKVLLTSSGETVDQFKRVQDQLVDLLGLASPVVFQTTVEVAQAELERVQLTSVSKELSRALGGGEDVDASIRQLENHVREMERGLKSLSREPGILRSLEDNVARLRDRQQRLVADVAELDRTRLEYMRLRERLTELEADLASKHTLLDLNLETLRLEQQLDALRREKKMLADRLDRIDQTHLKLKEIGQQLQEVTALGIPDNAVVASAKISAARIAHLEAEISRVRSEPSPSLPIRSPLPWIAAALGLALVVAGGLLSAIADSIRIALAAAGLAVCVGGLALWRRDSIEIARVTSLLRESESRLWTLERELDSVQRELSERLAALDGEPLDAAEQRVQRYQQLIQNRVESLKVIEALRADTTEESIRDRLSAVDSDIYGLTKELQLETRAARRLIPLDVQRLADEVSRLQKAVVEEGDQAKRLAWEVEHRKRETEDLVAVEEQLQEIEEALQAARRRHAIYTAALEGLLEARRQLVKPVREVVAGRASDYLRILSSGRYDRLEVEKDSLQVWVWSADAHDRIEPKEPFLSRGTIDLVYLSLRLALVTVLAEGRRPPILLDDPFVTFDERRRAAATRLLKELSKSHQIFLFTCTRHYDAVAERLIELSLPENEAAPTEEPTRPRVLPEARPVGPLWDQSQ